MSKRLRTIELEGLRGIIHSRILVSLALLLPRRRGLRTLTRLLGRVFGASTVTIWHERGFKFRFALDDPYWTPVLFRSYDYEEEVAEILETCEADVFVDCGANKGYWTAFAVTKFSEVIAVEASKATYRELLINAEGARTVHAAVYSKSGESIELIRSQVKHGAAYLKAVMPAWKDRSRDDTVEVVETVTLDELVAPGKRALIKLDVEGAEIAALQGATRLIKDGVTIVYEDHGRDPDCRVTNYLMQRGLSIYHDGRRLKSASEVRELKRNSRKGYNFLAVSHAE